MPHWIHPAPSRPPSHHPDEKMRCGQSWGESLATGPGGSSPGRRVMPKASNGAAKPTRPDAESCTIAPDRDAHPLAKRARNGVPHREGNFAGTHAPNEDKIVRVILPLDVPSAFAPYPPLPVLATFPLSMNYKRPAVRISFGTAARTFPSIHAQVSVRGCVFRWSWMQRCAPCCSWPFRYPELRRC